MDIAQTWQKLFDNWPADMPRLGILITTFDESIAFNDFLIQEGLIVVQRERPDSLGARKAIVSLLAINAVKMTDPSDISVCTKLGFQRGGTQASAVPTRPSLPQMPRRPLTSPSV